MTILSVPDMHCDNCVRRINAVLDEAGIGHTVSLEARTVAIDGCAHCVETALSELDDIGFPATVKEDKP